MPQSVLQSALAPRSVAVIGASDNPHKVGGRPILYLKRYRYPAAIYPINPTRAAVQGLPAYASLEAMDALSQLARHAAMLGKRAAPLGREVVAPPAGGERFLNEAESLAV